MSQVQCQANVPGIIQASVPGIIQAYVPGTMLANVLGTMQAYVPGTIQANIPGTIQANVPGTILANVPGKMLAYVLSTLDKMVANWLISRPKKTKVADFRYKIARGGGNRLKLADFLSHHFVFGQNCDFIHKKGSFCPVADI